MAHYNTTELDSDERAALERLVATEGVMGVCSMLPCKPDTLRRAREGAGLREHVLDRFRRVLAPHLDPHGLSAAEREALSALVSRRVNHRGESTETACKTLIGFLERRTRAVGALKAPGGDVVSRFLDSQRRRSA